MRCHCWFAGRSLAEYGLLSSLTSVSFCMQLHLHLANVRVRSTSDPEPEISVVGFRAFLCQFWKQVTLLVLSSESVTNPQVQCFRKFAFWRWIAAWMTVTLCLICVLCFPWRANVWVRSGPKRMPEAHQDTCLRVWEREDKNTLFVSVN